jgi:hypothetical protein
MGEKYIFLEIFFPNNMYLFIFVIIPLPPKQNITLYTYRIDRTYIKYSRMQCLCTAAVIIYCYLELRSVVHAGRRVFLCDPIPKTFYHTPVIYQLHNIHTVFYNTKTAAVCFVNNSLFIPACGVPIIHMW